MTSTETKPAAKRAPAKRAAAAAKAAETPEEAVAAQLQAVVDQAKVDELVEYKRLVRRRALMAKRSQGWPAESLNRTLRVLGLEGTGQTSVVKEVVLKARYRREVSNEAEGRQVIEHLRGYQENPSSLVSTGWVQDWEYVEQGDAKAVDLSEVIEPDPIAVSGTIEEYKRLVRRVGLEVAEEQGWCDSGVNEYLEALSLPLKMAYRVPIQTLIEQTASITIGNAESYEDAERIVREMDNEALRQKMIDCGAISSAVQVREVQPIDADAAVAVGGRDFDRAHTQYCMVDGERQYNPRGLAYCTRENGHGGNLHYSGNGTTILEVWTREEATTRV